jgi:hypothetical protein
MGAVAEDVVARRDFRREFDAYVKANFERDIASHVIKERHRDGIYGHWICARPDTVVLHFHIVTYPGGMLYTGDMGTFVFERTFDMISFMRSACRSRGYAAEKCRAVEKSAAGNGIEVFFDEIFEENLDEFLDEYESHHGEPITEEKLASISYLREYRGEDEHRCMMEMYESGLWDCGDMPTCRYYSVHFLWCLHAIEWFCKRVDLSSHDGLGKLVGSDALP